jgi:hypothetical protein
VDELPFDPERPPEEPPTGVVQPMLWRVAVRLHRDHDAIGRNRSRELRCDMCRQPWPCFGRRLAQRALVAAWRPVPAQAGAAGYVDRVLGIAPGGDWSGVGVGKLG